LVLLAVLLCACARAPTTVPTPELRVLALAATPVGVWLPVSGPYDQFGSLCNGCLIQFVHPNGRTFEMQPGVTGKTGHMVTGPLAGAYTVRAVVGSGIVYATTAQSYAQWDTILGIGATAAEKTLWVYNLGTAPQGTVTRVMVPSPTATWAGATATTNPQQPTLASTATATRSTTPKPTPTQSACFIILTCTPVPPTATATPTLTRTPTRTPEPTWTPLRITVCLSVEMTQTPTAIVGEAR